MSGITYLPNSFAFAFALILIRSKPTGITIEDYVLALRKSSSSAPNSFVPELGLIDRSRLWQQLFHLSQQTNLYLRGTIATFHNEICQDTKDPEPVEKVVGRKRKLRSISRVGSQTKNRIKRQRLSPSSEIGTKVYHKHEEEQHNDRTLILQVIFQLNRMVREPTSKMADFTVAISTACDAILQITKNAQSASIADRSGRSQIPTLNEACQAASRVWSAIISNLEAERAISYARSELAPLAVPMSSIVRSILDQLRENSLDEAEWKHNESLKMDSSETTELKRRSGNTPNGIGLFRHNRNVITCSLIHVMSTAGKLHKTHEEIFDATTGVFLQYVGETVGLHLFGNWGNGSTIEYVVPLPGMAKASRIGISHMRSAARLEAPHLVEVLRTFVQKLVPGNLGCTSTKVFQNLQKTLLQGIFGSEDGQTSFPTYSVELMNSSAVNNVNSGLAQDENDEDWFLTQVWELLGWDVLIG